MPQLASFGMTGEDHVAAPKRQFTLFFISVVYNNTIQRLIPKLAIYTFEVGVKKRLEIAATNRNLQWTLIIKCT